MRGLAVTAFLIAASVPAAAQSVEVAGGDWSQVPVLRAQGKELISAEAVAKAERIITKGSCADRGWLPTAELRVPFLLEFSSDGSVERIIVSRLGCQELETLMGGVVQQLARAGEFKPTGENQANWYRSEIRFSAR